MINYNWTLKGVDIEYLPDTNEAQLIEVHWSCVAIDDETELSARGVGSINVKDEGYVYPAATVKQLTKTQVFQFLNKKLGDEKQEIKANLANRLARKAVRDSFEPV